MIDWKLALSTANRLTKPGPEMEASEVAEAVAELREGAARSEGPVREFSRLHASPASARAPHVATAPVLIVDRPRWIKANLDTFRVLMEPVLSKLADSEKRPSGFSRTVGSKVGGAEVGALMSCMSTKVLGQFDPFWSGTDGEGGRLLLVAPNIVHVERQLGVDPHDFRLWVCLHEETHRAQFGGVPWLGGHLIAEIHDYLSLADSSAGEVLQANNGSAIGQELITLAGGVNVAADADGALVTAGGRVLNVVGRGADAAEARRCAYEALAHVRWPGLHHRSDIALTP